MSTVIQIDLELVCVIENLLLLACVIQIVVHLLLGGIIEIVLLLCHIVRIVLVLLFCFVILLFVLLRIILILFRKLFDLIGQDFFLHSRRFVLMTVIIGLNLVFLWQAFVLIQQPQLMVFLLVDIVLWKAAAKVMRQIALVLILFVAVAHFWGDEGGHVLGRAIARGTYGAIAELEHVWDVEVAAMVVEGLLGLIWRFHDVLNLASHLHLVLAGLYYVLNVVDCGGKIFFDVLQIIIFIFLWIRN